MIGRVWNLESKSLMIASLFHAQNNEIRLQTLRL